MGKLVIEKDINPAYPLAAADLLRGHVYEDSRDKILWLGCDIVVAGSRIAAVSVDGEYCMWSDIQAQRFRSVNAKLVVENWHGLYI